MVKKEPLLFFVIVLLLGCAQEPRPNKFSSIQQTGPTKEQAAATRARPYVEGQAALVRYVKAPGCDGPDAEAIKNNIAGLEHYVSSFHSILPEYEREARERHVDLTFSFADEALKKSCLSEADQAYRSLISFYTGTAYSGIRDRAKVGVDDVRAAQSAR